MSTNIKVAVRVRSLDKISEGPVSKSDQDFVAAGEAPASKLTAENLFQFLPNNQLVFKFSSSDIKSFSFDNVYDPTATQDLIYQTSVEPLIEKFIQGINCTVFAYGQTGSGKTFTMGIAPISTTMEDLSNRNDPGSKIGITPRAIMDIFQKLDGMKTTGYEYSITAFFLELYNEDLIDLGDKGGPKSFLPKPKPALREDESGNVFVSNVNDQKAVNAEELLKFLTNSCKNRSTAATDMNLTSSRSHAIFTITLKQKTHLKNGSFITKNSKFNFVDLAGSERLKKAGSDGDRMKEGIAINQGLLTLGNVISALGDESKRATHVPYRDSKLTRLLQESLGGNSQTLMISCVSPQVSNTGETLNTLMYSNRAKYIKNAIKVNQEWGGDNGVESLKIIKDLKETIGGLNQALETEKLQSQSILEISNKRTDRVKELEEQMELLRFEFEKTMQEKDGLQAEMGILSAQLSQLEIVFAQKIDGFDSLSKQFVANQGKVETLETQLYSSSKVQQAQLKRLEELSSANAKIWQEKSTLYSNASQNEEQLKGEIQTLKKENEDFKQKHEFVSKELETLKLLFSERQDLNTTKIAEMHSLFQSEVDTLVDNHKVLLDEKAAELQNAALQLEEQKKLFEKLENEFYALRDEKIMLEQERSKAESELKLEREATEGERLINQSAKLQIETSLAELKDLKSTLNLTMLKLEEMTNAKKEQEKKNGNLESENTSKVLQLKEALEELLNASLRVKEMEDEMTKYGVSEQLIQQYQEKEQNLIRIWETKLQSQEKKFKDMEAGFGAGLSLLKDQLAASEKRCQEMNKVIELGMIKEKELLERIGQGHKEVSEINNATGHDEDSTIGNNENTDHCLSSEASPTRPKKVSLRKKKDTKDTAVRGVGKKTAGVLTSIAQLMSSPGGVRQTRSRAKNAHQKGDGEEVVTLKYFKKMMKDS